jgi:hypothetical protein
LLSPFWATRASARTVHLDSRTGDSLYFRVASTSGSKPDHPYRSNVSVRVSPVSLRFIEAQYSPSRGDSSQLAERYGDRGAPAAWASSTNRWRRPAGRAGFSAPRRGVVGDLAHGRLRPYRPCPRTRRFRRGRIETAPTAPYSGDTVFCKPRCHAGVNDGSTLSTGAIRPPPHCFGMIASSCRRRRAVLMLPFSCPFGATKSGKRQQTPAQGEGRALQDFTSDDVRSGSLRHTRAKSG